MNTRAIFGLLLLSMSVTACSKSVSGSTGDDTTVSPNSTPGPGSSITPRTALACTLKTQGGSCDQILDLGASTYTKYDGSGVPAGGLLCLKAGDHPNGKLILQNITGSAGHYTQIKNCGGTFSIGNSIDANRDGIVDSSAGIEIQNSKYFLFSGTGSSATYGINIVGSSAGQTAFNIGELSTDYEVEFTQVQNAGFAGIMAKTEPNCTDTNAYSFRGGFVQRNVSFHDNYIHDTQGEGFYIGYSFPDGLDVSCSGHTVHVYSHPVDNLKVYNNILERTGCEAIQFGMSTNSEVHHNYINGYGRSPFSIYQNNGIQIGGKSGGKVYSNFILNPDPAFSVANGIIIIGSEDSLIYSNTIVNAGDGMYIHNQAAPSKTVTIVNNTIVNPTGSRSSSHQGSGIWNNNTLATIRLVNNLVVMGPVIETGIPVSQLPTAFGVYDQTSPQNSQRAGIYSNNITATTNLSLNPGDAGGLFVNAAALDFRVKSANALNQGTSVSGLGVLEGMTLNSTNETVTGTSRALGGTDIGAFESQ